MLRTCEEWVKKGHFDPLISGLGVKVAINTVNIEYSTPSFPL